MPTSPLPQFYPCLCLNLGFFLFMMYNLPLRLTTMQPTLRFLMDDLTFIDEKNFAKIQKFYDFNITTLTGYKY